MSRGGPLFHISAMHLGGSPADQTHVQTHIRFYFLLFSTSYCRYTPSAIKLGAKFDDELRALLAELHSQARTSRDLPRSPAISRDLARPPAISCNLPRSRAISRDLARSRLRISQEHKEWNLAHLCARLDYNGYWRAPMTSH